MREIELRGWENYLEGKQSSAGILTLILVYPITLLGGSGLDMLNQFLFSKGWESFAYVVAIFVVDAIQDYVTSKIVEAKTGITCFSRYYGNAFSERTLMTAIPAASGTMWVGGNMAMLGFVSQKLKLGTFSE